MDDHIYYYIIDIIYMDVIHKKPKSLILTSQKLKDLHSAVFVAKRVLEIRFSGFRISQKMG